MSNSENASASEMIDSHFNEEKNNLEPKTISVSHSTLSNLEKQRLDDDEMCDVILQVEDAELPAHRNVLAASSDYFLKMFTTNMKEKLSKNVAIKSVTPTAMREILKSVYTTKICFTKENISDILHGASLMLFPGVISAAARYVQQSITMQNCFWFRKLANAHSLDSLKEEITRFFLVNFEKASTYSEFLNLTSNELVKIVASDDLLIKKEENVFKVIVKWVRKDVEGRKEDFPSLFKHVRIHCVSLDYIIDVMLKIEFLTQFHDCRNLLDRAFVHHFRPSVPTALNQRKCFVTDSIMFVSYGVPTLHATLDFETEVWKEMSKEAPNINESCAVASKHPITIFCGLGDSNKQVVQFDGFQWKDLPQMNRARIGAASVFFGEKLFVFGGENASVPAVGSNISPSYYSSEEKFENNFETLVKTWKLHQIEFSRSHFAVQCIGKNIYIIGGYESVRKHYKEVCGNTMVYCPAKNSWKEVESLMTARALFGSAVLNSKIYVFGGKGQNFSNLNSVEIFNVYEKTWTSGGSIEPGPKSACVISGEIYFLDVLNERLWKYKESNYASHSSCIEINRNVPGQGVLLPFSKQYYRYHF